MAPAKKSSESLGRSLLKKRRNQFDPSTRHSVDNVGSSGTKLSVTENSSIDEFLSNAEAAQRSFEAERGHAAIANLGTVNEEDTHLTSDEENEEEEEFCSIPKKPDWHGSETAEEFKQLETKVFLEWKRRLNRLQHRHPNLPPFEKNLDFWRQLWKIVELSNVVIQVVDARDPLFYYSYDLAQYVQEVSPLKVNVMLLNKADFLTEKQRTHWADHFKDSDTFTLFFSATLDEVDKLDSDDNVVDFNTSKILSPKEVLVALRSLVRLETSEVLTVGFLGYPNVGKSSTINRFLTSKKLQVSATPGKTKHYQTHAVGGGDIVLVDGPGLVIPDLRMTKPHMVLAGILPIDTLTEPMPCIEMLLEKLPFALIQDFYGIVQSCVVEAKKSERKSQALQILGALGLMRGFMKPGGVPDHTRAARLILKDYVQGKLVFCQAPPNFNQDDFCTYDPRSAKPHVVDDFDLDLEDSFPELRVASGVHVRGKKGPEKEKRHGNKNKREKIRRVYNESPYA